MPEFDVKCRYSMWKCRKSTRLFARNLAGLSVRASRSDEPAQTAGRAREPPKASGGTARQLALKPLHPGQALAPPMLLPVRPGIGADDSVAGADHAPGRRIAPDRHPATDRPRAPRRGGTADSLSPASARPALACSRTSSAGQGIGRGGAWAKHSRPPRQHESDEGREARPLPCGFSSSRSRNRTPRLAASRKPFAARSNTTSSRSRRHTALLRRRTDGGERRRPDGAERKRTGGLGRSRD